jgi:hypothetical protein
MEQKRYTKKDMSLFREKLPGWQETYIERLCKEYVKILSGEGNASERFWELDKRMKEDKRYTGVRCTTNRSDLILLAANLLCEDAITMEDLSDFSEEFHKSLEVHRRIWGV